jgi:hypothetical protein
MFRRNQDHLQARILSDLNLLTAKQLKRLDESWAGVFRREVFARLDETPFAVLYSDAASRPNIPVNVLLGLETLKAGHNWSDEEMHDAFSFDVQVRYALGYDNLGQGEFDLRTIYNFRQRLSDHMQQTGENLVEVAFRQVTDEQLKAFELRTDCLRMDSTQIASNIRFMTRLHLLVEVIQRAHHMLSTADQARYAEAFAPYLKGSAGQFIYHLRKEAASSHLQGIGELLHRLLTELAPTYATHQTFALLQRVFQEQFVLRRKRPQAKPDHNAGGSPPEMISDPVVGPMAPDDRLEVAAASNLDAVNIETGQRLDRVRVQVKPGRTLATTSLLSPDDPEATYRRKGDRPFRGYVTNVTETCTPANPFQLIVQVQTAPNITEDAHLLIQTLPDLKARTGVETLYNDAAFCSPAADRLLHQYQVTQVPTDLQGPTPNPTRLGLADFIFQTDPAGIAQQITCPRGQCVAVMPAQKRDRYVARFDAPGCSACPLQARCPTQAGHSKTWRTLYFSQTQLDVTQRRQRCSVYHQGSQNLRAAIESTLGALKRPFSDDQLPVRGGFRVGVMMLESAWMVNVRRIQRYLVERDEQRRRTKDQARQVEDQNPSGESFLFRLFFRFLNLLGFLRANSAPSVLYSEVFSGES